MITLSDHVVLTSNLGYEYPQLVSHVLSVGNHVYSRLGGTRELLDFRLELSEPDLCVVDRPGFSHSFMNEEILQLLAGMHNNDRLRAVTPQAADLITAATAYGPRTREQLLAVADELKTSRDSRRGVVYIGRHDDLVSVDDGSRASEMPCTMTWQFHLRNDQLHMTVNMRSWDLVWGLGYDVPSFVAVQMMLCNHLGVGLGWYVHNAGSAHVYERHYGLQAVPQTTPLDVSHLLKGTVAATQANARVLLRGGTS